MTNQKKETARKVIKNLLKTLIFVVAVGVYSIQDAQQRNQLLKLPAISSVEYREESFCSSNLQKSVNSHMKGESNPCSSTRISSMKCESNPCSPTRISSKFPRKRKSFGLRRMKIRIDTDPIYFIIDGPNSNYYYFESRISRKDIPIVVFKTTLRAINKRRTASLRVSLTPQRYARYRHGEYFHTTPIRYRSYHPTTPRALPPQAFCPSLR